MFLVKDKLGCFRHFLGGLIFVLKFLKFLDFFFSHFFVHEPIIEANKGIDVNCDPIIVFFVAINDKHWRKTSKTIRMFDSDNFRNLFIKHPISLFALQFFKFFDLVFYFLFRNFSQNPI